MLQAMLKDDSMAARIRLAIDRIGRPRKEIAEDLDVSPQALTGWQRTGRISKEKLAGLASMAGMSMEELLGRQGVTSPPSPALPPDAPAGPAQQASDVARLDPQRLETSVRFLEQQFALWGREFIALERTSLIAAVYDFLATTSASSNLVSLSQWLANKLGEEDAHVGSGEAGRTVGHDQKRAAGGP